jgi:hypothetical protein
MAPKAPAAERITGETAPRACQLFGLTRLSRISRNSFGPLGSLRFRACRSSSGADGSIRRSNAWPAISRAFAGRLERTGLLWPGRVQHRNDRLAMIAYDIGGVVVVPAPAGPRQRLFSASFAAPDQGEAEASRSGMRYSRLRHWAPLGINAVNGPGVHVRKRPRYWRAAKRA